MLKTLSSYMALGNILHPWSKDDTKQTSPKVTCMCTLTPIADTAFYAVAKNLAMQERAKSYEHIVPSLHSFIRKLKKHHMRCRPRRCLANDA